MTKILYGLHIIDIMNNIFVIIVVSHEFSPTIKSSIQLFFYLNTYDYKTLNYHIVILCNYSSSSIMEFLWLKQIFHLLKLKVPSV